MEMDYVRKDLQKKDWLLPGFFALVVIFVVASVTWLYQSKYLERHRKDLEALSNQVAMTINANLEGSLEYLQLLAEAMVDGRLTEENFRERSSVFVRDHPGLINIIWADSNYIIRWAAPSEPNKQVIGLKLSLPEPARASRTARETGQAVYTRPYTVIQGVPAFEVYVPVLRDGQFLGTFGGVFSIKNVLLQATPPQVADHGHFAIQDKSGKTLAELAPGRKASSSCTVSFPLEPPGFGTTLKVSDYHSHLFAEWLLIGMIGVALSLGLLLTLAKLKKQVTIRERAEQLAAQNEARLRSIYQAVHAGIVLKDVSGEILHANQVACEIFRMREDEIIGRTSTDPLWHMVDEDGNEVPGENHPSMITLRTQLPINNVIRGLFADDPKIMVWLSISTQPIFDPATGRIKEVLITFHDISRTKHLQENLEYLTVHDPLTGLLNRRFLEEEAVKEIARAERYQSPLSFLMIDIDHFKRINDSYGHKTGDHTLCILAGQLTELTRESDYLARYGGEEFILILPGTPTEQALNLAEKLRRQIENVPFPIGKGENLTLTVSIGIATFPAHGLDWEALFKAADAALYRAKQNGRNRVEIAGNH